MTATSTESSQPVVRLTISYLGTHYAGWQIQPNAVTVQQRLEEALLQFSGLPMRATAAGRTDAGVHADGQEVHLALDRAAAPGSSALPALPTRAWLHGLNQLLPSDVRVVRAQHMAASFHARRSAQCKRYRYRWWSGDDVMTPHEALVRAPLLPAADLDRLVSLAGSFLGTHDFAAFAKSGGARVTTRRTIRRCEVIRLDQRRFDLVVEGPGFLRGMVRAIAGTLQEAARGRISQSEIGQLLLGATRAESGPNAPARGLTLEAVEYAADGRNIYPAAREGPIESTTPRNPDQE